MKTRALLPIALAFAVAWPAVAAEAPKAPETRKDPVVETLHGVSVSDPYRWLEDQQSPETRRWIEAQNAYTEGRLREAPEREPFVARLGELLRTSTVNVPVQRAGRLFYSKRAADQDLFVLYVRRAADAAEEALVDPHGLSADHTTSVTLQDVSADGRTLAYGVRDGGQDELVVRFRDVETKQDRADLLPKGRYYGVALSPDGRTAYYSRQTEAGPRVYAHAMGADPARDEKLFGAGYGPEKIVWTGLSDDGRWLVIGVLHGSAATKVEIYAKDVAAGGPVVPIVNDLEARFQPSIGGDTMYLLTDWQAPRYRVMAVDLRRPARAGWREVVPQGKGVISSVASAGGHLYVETLEDVKSKLRVHAADGRLVREVELPSIGSIGTISGDFGADPVYFSFSSFAQPTTVYRYSTAGGERSVFARVDAPVSSEHFTIEQTFYASKDGTRIPMFLAYKKGLVKDGARPTWLTAYGGFSVSMTPAFSASAVAWMEQGGLYALPNLRGGGEYGEEWHHAGMLDRKQNVFDDFIAAAEWLVANGYTKPEKLAISGGSNGGLLVGAAVTQRPELFGAVVCSVPLLDMLRYQNFLVARYWVPEYGSAEDARQFPALYAYSPYHRVKPGTKYPAVLFVSGDGDTRVAPLHARKMAALMQAAQGGGAPILLKYDTKAGHSGGLPVTKTIEDTSVVLQFVSWQLGVKQN
ncbi:MAG: prolyl oligopeptidase family protein [Vicinamibacteria bacterium]